MKSWKSLSAFFLELNKQVEYVVLRNHESFLSGKLIDEHPDIDILCRDTDLFIKCAGSETRMKKGDKIHQKTLIDGKEVSLDIRHIGDGYYDTQWEENILTKRYLINDLCYVMDSENYFYSLLYHALIQKYAVSLDYATRLTQMGKRLGIDFAIDSNTINILQRYMKDKNYHFTYPEYSGGVANFKHVDKSMIEVNLHRLINRYMYKIIRKFKTL